MRLHPLEILILEELCAREKIPASRAEMVRRLIARAALDVPAAKAEDATR